MLFTTKTPTGEPIHFATERELFEYLVTIAPEMAQSFAMTPASIDEALRDGMKLGVTLLARMMTTAMQDGHYAVASDCLHGAYLAAETWHLATMVSTESEQPPRKN